MKGKQKRKHGATEEITGDRWSSERGGRAEQETKKLNLSLV